MVGEAADQASPISGVIVGRSPESAVVERRAQLAEIAWRAVESAALLTLSELGVFQRLLGGPQPIQDVCGKSVSPGRLRPFLDLAVSIGVLRRAGDRYGLIDGDEQLFDARCPEPEILGNLRLEPLARAAALLTDNETAVAGTIQAQGELSEYAWSTFLRYWDRRVVSLAAETAPLLIDEPMARFADFGCGTGTFSRALLTALPNSTASLFDSSPVCLSISKELGEAAGVGARMTLHQADLLSPSVEGEPDFELAIMSIVLSGFSPADAQQLIRGAAARLRPGGRLAIVEPALADDRSGPADALRYGVYRSIQSLDAVLHTESDLIGWAGDAGLMHVSSWELRALYPTHRLVLHRKPAVACKRPLPVPSPVSPTIGPL